MIVAIDHVQLAMPPGEEDTARAFYAGRLGLVELTKPEALRARGGCWFTAGSVQVHLGVEAEFRPARKAHPALVVSDLESFVSAAELDARWDDDLPGRRHCYVDDPFGNRIELIDAG